MVGSTISFFLFFFLKFLICMYCVHRAMGMRTTTHLPSQWLLFSTGEAHEFMHRSVSGHGMSILITQKTYSVLSVNFLKLFIPMK